MLVLRVTCEHGLAPLSVEAPDAQEEDGKSEEGSGAA
jgi:hypothetical protein